MAAGEEIELDDGVGLLEGRLDIAEAVLEQRAFRAAAGLELAGALWAGAFVLFLVAYAPILFGPRLDSKPG